MQLSGFVSFLTRSRVRNDPRTVTRSHMATILALGSLASLIACRDAAAQATSCQQYPIVWRPAEGTHEAAQAELSSLSPGASMTWNSNTGTLRSILQLATPLPGCTDGQDVAAQVLGVLTAHPTLFQLDPAEWRTPAPFDCRFLGDRTTLTLGRHHLAGRPVARDVFAFSLQRIDGVVHLTTVTGVYLPVVGAEIGDRMAACNNLTETAAITTARSTPLRASTFSQCRPTGTVTYTPKQNDTFRFASGEVWTWQESSAETQLSGERTLRVIVAPANYTPALLSSDARCPTPDGDGDDFTVGFDITLDVHTGAVVSVKPGLDCIVC
jgi:hypothetical protein